MPRYLVEFCYKGTHYNGLAVQNNVPKNKTIQACINIALQTILRQEIKTTTSSRTDAGVHARQNFLHFDWHENLPLNIEYTLNAILPKDIYIISITPVSMDFHARFSATSREYNYYINTCKNPFTQETAWHYYLPIDIEKLNACSNILFNYTDFTSFSKLHTDTTNNNCTIIHSAWTKAENNTIIYNVKANRFLRGMVRALVGTMLHVHKQEDAVEKLQYIIEAKDCKNAKFSTPAHGLFLQKVNY